ncbi:MAG: HAD-IIA family hydrolase [Bellilinea sp.]
MTPNAISTWMLMLRLSMGWSIRCSIRLKNRPASGPQSSTEMPDSISYPAFFFPQGKNMLKTLKPAIKALILDLDGVLWRGNQPIGNLQHIFQRINQHGLKVICATNNSTSTPSQVSAKIAEMGVILSPESILTSAEASALYLKKIYPAGRWVYIVGEVGLSEALRKHGFLHSDTQPLAVVAGMDRQISYEKLAGATHWIRRGVPFIGTNPDKTFPIPDGLAPGAGSILAAIEAASDVQPTIIGKPSPYLYQIAMEQIDTTPQETLAVGDRLETDILGGQRAGMRTALVLSGVTTRKQLDAWPNPPDLVAADLTELLDGLP